MKKMTVKYIETVVLETDNPDVDFTDLEDSGRNMIEEGWYPPVGVTVVVDRKPSWRYEREGEE